ncbi:hypothetical protein HID58_001455 [Brassica napus]|uniref:Conserved oligomeric Golgi complex subunit 2 n=2 Tax=Brassica TaxID=3705 RepID=A0ABQ8EJI4_BRANA|nr:hypothetical protein HID58_001455 [Brassica napus]
MSDLVTTLPSPSSAPRSASDFFSDPYDSHPLWFKPSLFLSPVFDSESYISELRTFVPFDTLRSELRSHLASLNRELVDLINRDYADFVSLSTKLVDIDEAVVRMRAPLLGLREKIAAFRGSVEAALFALRSGLQQRSDAASAREVLELLLDTFHVVSKVEKLIKVLPSAPSDWQKEDGGVSLRSSVSVENSTQQDGTTMRETQSMLLERIASEMNRLKFYMAHAQNLPFVENMEKRIQSANVLLDASLGHSFIDGLNNSDTSVLYNCLRAYAAIDNTKSAEEIFRTTIVAPFIHKIVALETSNNAAGSSGDELENDYKQIKHFIAKDCKMLLGISSTDKSGLHVFDFLANSILKEVLSAIQKVKPGAFSPGRPTQFLKNYKASLEFLAYLEGYCPSRTAVTKFRTEAVYIEFMKQWNVGVYFSLRFQEIAGALDSALTSPSLVFIQDSDLDKRSSPNLILRQSATLLESLRSCWEEDVLVFSAADKFLRLTLQLLSRYCVWVSSSLHTRRGNPSPSPGCDWAVSATTEDFVYDLRQVRGITTTYRMTNKPPPVRHSPYVVGILRHVKAFLEGDKATHYLTQETREEILLGTVTDITRRYYESADEVVSLARRTESSLQQFRRKAQKRAGAASGASDDNVSETDKMCMQLFLDAQLSVRRSQLVGNALATAIRAVLSSDGQAADPKGAGLRGKLKKVVLAYSGGLDTSVIVPWLKYVISLFSSKNNFILWENYGCEVVCFTADVGQGIKELDGLEQKAKASGASQLVVKDLTEEFVKDYIFPCLRAGAIYERKYLLGTSMARPVIAKAMVDVAAEVGADAVAHGCTGKGNDQAIITWTVRFELTFFSLNPELKVVAPWREWEIQGREDAIEYAKKHNVPVPVTKKSIYSRDRNLWHLSHEGDILEDPANEPKKDMYMMSVDPEDAPDQPEYIEIGIESGLPVSFNGKALSPATLLSELNAIGGKHGIGRIDMVENRLVGMKSRGVYETPGGTILFAAVQELESLTLDRESIQVKDSLALKYAEMVYAGRWFDPLKESMDAFMEKLTEKTTGSVTLKLYKGSVSVTGRKSPNSLYRQDISSFEGSEIYNQADAAGFIPAMDGGAEGSQQPHLILAHKLFLLTHPDVQDIEKVQLKSDVLDSIKSDGMAPLYETLTASSVLELDQSLLDSMRATNEEELKKLDENSCNDFERLRIADAEENLGESEVREAHLAKALYFVRISDKEKALEQLKLTEGKTVAVGQKMDLVFYTLQLAFFYMDFDLVSKSIDKAKKLFEEGGDWERKNRLKVYEGLYCMSTRNFKKAASLFLDSISTFTTYEIFPYETFIFYTVLTSIITLDRVSLKQKVVDAPEILTVLGKIPFLSEFLNSLYECQYKAFFSAFAGMAEQIKFDRYLNPHFRFYMREVRTVVYSQFLESYKSVTVDAMANAFGVSVDFIDQELSRFIAAGKLHCKIDKVAGVLETNRPDAKNALYQATIKQGDFLLNRIQKLSRVIDL